jgi:uncharacterized integral membrane protein
MAKRLIGWFVLVPLCAVLVVFALANRQLVTVNFDPISTVNPLVPSLDVPLFAVIYVMLVLGMLLGGIAVWTTQGHHRRDKRAFRRENQRLSAELEKARKSPPVSDQLLVEDGLDLD